MRSTTAFDEAQINYSEKIVFSDVTALKWGRHCQRELCNCTALRGDGVLFSVEHGPLLNGNPLLTSVNGDKNASAVNEVLGRLVELYFSTLDFVTLCFFENKIHVTNSTD